jgi:hypothetical protein
MKHYSVKNHKRKGRMVRTHKRKGRKHTMVNFQSALNAGAGEDTKEKLEKLRKKAKGTLSTSEHMRRTKK